MNIVILSGHVDGEPEVYTSKTGLEIANSFIKLAEKKDGKQNLCKITAFGGVAKKLANIPPGRKIAAQCRVDGGYREGKDGKQYMNMSIIVSSFEEVIEQLEQEPMISPKQTPLADDDIPF